MKKNQELEKKLRDIRKSIAAPAVVFTLGVMESGDIDIIDVKAIHDLPQSLQDIGSEGDNFGSDMSDSDYIG